MKEALYRLWLTIEIAALLLLFTRPLWAQPPVANSLGTFPLPRAVGMTGKVHAITLDVYPKLAVASPWKAQTFHIRWRIEPKPEHRNYTLTADCGKEFVSSSRETQGIASREWFVDLTVLNTCWFEVCVYPKGTCVRQRIEVPP